MKNLLTIKECMIKILEYCIKEKKQVDSIKLTTKWIVNDYVSFTINNSYPLSINRETGKINKTKAQ